MPDDINSEINAAIAKVLKVIVTELDTAIERVIDQKEDAELPHGETDWLKSGDTSSTYNALQAMRDAVAKAVEL